MHINSEILLEHTIFEYPMATLDCASAPVMCGKLGYMYKILKPELNFAVKAM